jgi:hypothetical protein
MVAMDFMDDTHSDIRDAKYDADRDDPSIARARLATAVSKLERARKKLLACYRKAKP